MKKTLLLLVLALTLVLGGCSLVVKDPVVDAAQTILEINGETVDKQTVSSAYNSLINQQYQMQQMYQMYGMQAPPIDEAALLVQAKDLSVRRVVLAQQALINGADQLDEAGTLALQEEMAQEWQATLDWVKTNYLPDTTLEGDALTQELEHEAQDLGISRKASDDVVREQFISRRLEEAQTADVVVTDEDVQAAYDTKVAADQATYDADPNAYGNTVNGGTVAYYAPEGYRMIKQVLIKFLPEDQAIIDGLNEELSVATSALTQAQAALTQNEQALAAPDLSEADKQALEASTPELQAALTAARQPVADLEAQAEAARQAGYTKILPKAQDVVARAQAEDFDALVAQLNEDTGMPATGYAVREGFANFDEAFVVPAMALENVGDVSQPSPGIYGYYVVQYAAPVPAGPIALESVRQALHDDLLVQKKADTWQDIVEGWIQAADIKEYMSRLTD